MKRSKPSEFQLNDENLSENPINELKEKDFKKIKRIKIFKNRKINIWNSEEKPNEWYNIFENDFKIYENKIYNEYFLRKIHIKKINWDEIVNQNFIMKHRKPITSIRFTENEIISCSFDSKIHIMNKSDEQYRIFSGHSMGITDIFYGNNNLFSISLDKTMRIWDLRKEKCIFKKEMDFIPIRIAVDFKKMDFQKKGTKKLPFEKYEIENINDEKKLNFFSSIFLTSKNFLYIFDSNFNKIFEISANFIVKLKNTLFHFIYLSKDKILKIGQKSTFKILKIYENVIDFDTLNNKILISYENYIEILDLISNEIKVYHKNNIYKSIFIDESKFLVQTKDFYCFIFPENKSLEFKIKGRIFCMKDKLIFISDENEVKELKII